jgi:hypothetical protein
MVKISEFCLFSRLHFRTDRGGLAKTVGEWSGRSQHYLPRANDDRCFSTRFQVIKRLEILSSATKGWRPPSNEDIRALSFLC